MTQNFSAEATVSNWDGHLTVDNSVSALCSSSYLQRVPLNAEHYSGYAATATRNLIDCHKADTESANRECDSDPSCAPSESRVIENGVWCRKWVESPSDYYRAPNQKGISGQDGGSISRQPASRLAASSMQTTTRSSSVLGDSISEIVIEDVPNDTESTSALLDYCKHKFLRPYVAILSMVGLSPISTETTFFRACLNYLLDVFLLSLLLFGYYLQYLTSYRGDRGFLNYQKTLHPIQSPSASFVDTSENSPRTIDELLFGYIIPNTLHLLGFTTAVFVCRLVGNEQLQNLIERVFLMSMKPRRLCLMLWLYISVGFVFVGVLLACVTPSVLIQTQIIQVKWITASFNDCQMVVKILLLGAIFIQDLVEIIILTSYCIECYLLRVHLATLSHKLLMHSIDFLDWMREVLEFRKLLDHLNQRVALPVCFFIVMNLSYAFAGIVCFVDLDFQYSTLKVLKILSIINVLLWLVMGLIPFFMAASVTRVCQTAQANGHQIRVRPFLHHNTSSEDLNSTLLFAASLDMSAKLFRMPIQPNYLCFAILVVSIAILTLGMCLNLSVFGTL